MEIAIPKSLEALVRRKAERMEALERDRSVLFPGAAAAVRRLAAGAPLVVASQWPVDSDATAELMIRFHRLRKEEGLNTTRALRRAQQEMLSGPDERHRNPYYWAAFLPVGGHAEY